jgi:ribosome-associated protein
VICSGSNPKQVQAIADEVGLQLKKLGEHPISLEGYAQAEWILADYGDMLVHVFSGKAREYYDLERLWRAAKNVAIPVDESPDARAVRSDAQSETPAETPEA